MISHEQLECLVHKNWSSGLSPVPQKYKINTEREDKQNYIQFVLATHRRNFC